MRLVEFFRLTEKKKVVPLDKGNPHDDADEADWNNPGTFGMTQHGYSFSPEEHPGILLPEDDDDYRGHHQAPGKEDGAPLWNVTLNDIYPDDFYTNMYDYMIGGAGSDILGHLNGYYNRPNKQVTIYRAVPHEPSPAEQIAQLEVLMKKYMARNIVPPSYEGDPSKWYDVASKEMERLKQLPQVEAERYPINPGDWVTLSRRYAKEHGVSNLGGNFKIVSKKVYARDVYTDGNSLDEWGYEPTPRINKA